MKLESRQSQYCPRVDFKCANSFCELHKSSGLNGNCFSPTQTEHLRGSISPDVRLTWAGNIRASDRRLISLQLLSCSYSTARHPESSSGVCPNTTTGENHTETSGGEVYQNQLRPESVENRSSDLTTAAFHNTNTVLNRKT